METRVPRAGLPGPTTSSETFLLRTRPSKPGETPTPGGGLDKDLLERGSRQGLGEASSLARDFPLAKGALSPRQSAHGLCALCRVTDAPKRGDGSAVFAILVYKAVNKAAPSEGGARLAFFGDKETVHRYAPRATSPWGTSRAPAALARCPGWTVPLFSFGDAAPLPWTASMGSTFMVDSTFIVHRTSSFVAMW